MSYSQVRTFTKARIREADSLFREWEDGFNFENIPNNIYEKSYHIEMASVNSQSQNDSYSDENMIINVRLFFKGNRAVQENIDRAMDKAFDVKTKMINRANLVSPGNIKQVVYLSLTPSFPESNDNLIILTMSFSLRLAFRAC